MCALFEDDGVMLYGLLVDVCCLVRVCVVCVRFNVLVRFVCDVSCDIA